MNMATNQYIQALGYLAGLKQAVDLGQLARDAYGQLPAAHGFDLAVGGLAGAGAGGLYHALRGNNDDDQPQPTTMRGKLRRQSQHLTTLLQRMAVGAGVGAVGLNTLGDRARRYISNAPGMYSYDTSKVKDALTGKGWPGVWQGAVLDKPIPHTAVQNTTKPADYTNPDPHSSNGWSPELLVRRELLRRGLGVHSDSPQDFFQNTGTVMTPTGQSIPRIQLSERFTDPRTGLLRTNPDDKNIYHAIFGDLTKHEDYVGQGLAPIGHYSVDHPALDVARVRKSWNFAWEPDKRKIWHDLTHEVAQRPGAWTEPLPDQEQALDAMRRYDGTSPQYTKGDMLKSLASRWALDNLLVKKTPLFDTTVRYSRKTGDPVQEFSNIAHDAGVNKNDAEIAERLAHYQAGGREPARQPAPGLPVLAWP